MAMEVGAVTEQIDSRLIAARSEQIADDYRLLDLIESRIARFPL